MIWVRRILTGPLGLLFFLFLLLTLLVLQINSTFLDPDYYPEQLREANVYEFILNELLASAIDEEREKERRERDAGGSGQDVGNTPFLSSGLSTEQIVSSVNRALPPDWVQGLGGAEPRRGRQVPYRRERRVHGHGEGEPAGGHGR